MPDEEIREEVVEEEVVEEADPDNILSRTGDRLVVAGAPRGGTLRRAQISDAGSFNWLTQNSVDMSELQFYVHENFARQNFADPDSYVPMLATRVTVNEDRTEYTIHLREGVYWHIPAVDMADPRYRWLAERREVTAEDGAFYFEMARHPDVNASHLDNYVEDIVDVKVIDRYTFRVTWDRRLYHSEMTVLLAYPLPRWLLTRDRDGQELPPDRVGSMFENHWSHDAPIGTGPYTFGRYRRGEGILLERNDDYWGESPPIERIEFSILPDPEMQYARLRSGQIDFMDRLSEARYRSEILHGGVSSPFNDGSLEHEVVDQFAYFYIGWNQEHLLFEDRRVRRAMTHALDRQTMIDDVMYGLGTVQTGPYFYRHPANDPRIEPYPFDLERAAELLDEAGWVDTTGDGVRNRTIDGENHDFRFVLTSYNRPTVRTWTQAYAEALESIGVIMEMEYVDWPLMMRRMEERSFDAFTGGWGLGWQIDLFQIWHSSQADIPRGSNRVGFRNAEADEIAERLRETFDNEERLALLRRFHQIVHEEQPYTFFYAPQNVAAWNPRVRNVVFQKIRPQAHSLPWYIRE